jgi:hypothetical protein
MFKFTMRFETVTEKSPIKWLAIPKEEKVSVRQDTL